jgi:hypothetical protein
MDPALAQEIESLRRAKVAELKARYRELFQEESPSSNRAHLFRRLAWRLQARARGDLSERARQRATELADDAELRRRAPRRFWRALEEREQPTQRRDPRLPETGAVLMRVYQQRPIQVQVLPAGFEFEGKVYGSLSAIAYQVTGTRWNGFVFFGLGKAARRG